MRDEMNKKAEWLTTQMLLDMGVPAHLKGYRYVRTALIMVEEDMKVVGSVTKLLYPELAKRYNTTFEELFGYCAETGQGRPTNSEYIAVVADAVRIQMRK